MLVRKSNECSQNYFHNRDPAARTVWRDADRPEIAYNGSSEDAEEIICYNIILLFLLLSLLLKSTNQFIAHHALGIQDVVAWPIRLKVLNNDPPQTGMGGTGTHLLLLHG